MRLRYLILLLLFSQLTEAQNFVSFLDVETKRIKSEKSDFANNKIVPFTVMEGMMVVEASVNQRKGNFIIDTGAPTLVLNEAPSKNGKVAGRGISQHLITDQVKVEEFNWSGIEKQNLEAFRVDISHLEQVSGKSLAGIIGYEILKEVELLVDYSAKIILLSPVKTKLKSTKQPLAVIPFTMQAHLPVIKVKIGKKKLRLALDTASESNILDKRIYDKLEGSLVSDNKICEIQGVDQQIKTVKVATVQATKVKDLSFQNMPYLFTDLSHLKSEGDLYIDGLLGYPFFKEAKISINYKEKKIYVWEK